MKTKPESRAKKMGRPVRRPGEPGTRDRILDAAIRLFAEDGYEATSIKRITRAVNLTESALYRHFKGKEDLYTQAAENLFREFMEQFAARVLSLEDPGEAIAALIELRLTHSDEHRKFLRVFFETSLGSRVNPARAIPRHVARIYDGYLEAVRDLFERGIAQGIFDRGDPLYLALCLEGIINAFVAYWSRNEPTEALAVRIAKMKREFLGRIKLRLDDGPS